MKYTTHLRLHSQATRLYERASEKGIEFGMIKVGNQTANRQETQPSFENQKASPLISSCCITGLSPSMAAYSQGHLDHVRLGCLTTHYYPLHLQDTKHFLEATTPLYTGNP